MILCQIIEMSMVIRAISKKNTAPIKELEKIAPKKAVKARFVESSSLEELHIFAMCIRCNFMFTRRVYQIRPSLQKRIFCCAFLTKQYLPSNQPNKEDRSFGRFFLE